MLSTKIFLEVEKTSSFWTVMWICAPPNEIESTHLWKKKWNHYNLYTYIIVNQRWIRAGFGSQIGAWVIMYKEWIEMAMGRVWDRPLSSLSNSYLGFNSPVDFPFTSSLNGGLHPYSTDIHTRSPYILRKYFIKAF